MRKIKLSEISTGELLQMVLCALLLVLIVFWVSYYFIQPSPAGTIVMITQSAEYHARLDGIEASGNRINIPLAYYNELLMNFTR